MLEVPKRGPRINDDGDIISEKATAANDTIFDIFGGRRAFIEAEEAEELLKPLRKPNLYTKICFSNRSFGLFQ
jgi:Ran GTPase-activating protein 1